MWFLIASTFAAAPLYTLSFDERQAHLVHVRATLPAGAEQTELRMATWTPGSYLIREFSRNLESLRATTLAGEPLPITRTAKNRWTVNSGGADFQIDYDLYARAHNVRGNWVDTDLAVLNGAATFLTPVHHEGAYEVVVERPNGWEHTVSSLPLQEGRLHAESLDVLIDSPILVGNPVITPFEVGGVEHLLVDLPAAPGWDSKKAAASLKDVVEEEVRFWGEIPYDRYLFLNWIAEGRGGLEHANSTLLMTHRTATSDDQAFTAWLTLAAHEHFHAWNAKGLHPRGLGPFDYEHEVYTPDLWIVEGITSYYDDLLMVRAGLLDEDDLLDKISKSLSQLQATPGRRRQSLADASQAAWIKHYRPDENSRNSSVSYYTKGALVAWLLDAKIRSVTKGERSLDDVMRLAWKRLRGDPGYTSAAFHALIDEVAGVPMGEQMERWVNSTEELNLDEAIALYGLRLVPPTQRPEPWLGITLSDGRISQVRRDGPGSAKGLLVGDELLAIDNQRVTDDLAAVLDTHKPGESVVVLVSRQEQLRELRVVLDSLPHPVELVVGSSTRKQEKQRRAWLNSN